MSGQKQNVTYVDRNGEEQSFLVRGKGNVANYNIAAMTNDMNYQLAQEQNQWNIDQWNRENEYNSASAQIQRLKDAGLNPNLYNGDGNQAGHIESANLAQATTGNPMVDPSDRFATISNAAMGMLDRAQAVYNSKLATQHTQNETRSTDAQIKGIMSTIGRNTQENKESESRIELNASQRAELDKRIQKYDKEMEVSNATISNLRAQAQKAGDEGALARKQIEYLDSKNGREDMLAKAESAVNWKQVELYGSQIGLNKQESAKVAREILNLKADNLIKGQQMELNDIALYVQKNDAAFRKATQDFQLEHQTANYYFDKLQGFVGMVTDVAGTAASFGLNKALENNVNMRTQKISAGEAVPAQASVQSWRNPMNGEYNPMGFQ